MKSLFLIINYIVYFSAVQAQTNTQLSNHFPPVWGHYKKLSAYSTIPLQVNKQWNSLIFELLPNDTKIPSPDFTGTIIANGRERNPFYLPTGEVFDIPAPPANSSAQTRAELDYLLQLQQQRSAEDERISAFYATVYYRTAVKPGDADWAVMRRNLFHIGRSIGTWFNADSLPLTAKLVANVWKDAEYLIWKYKNYFVRIRPYKLEPRLKNLEETNWAAYPSGHATNSYVNAFLYTALIPEFESFFMKDAYDMAHSREIIGVHYPGDSESGRILAYQLIQRLMQHQNFIQDFDAARKEIERVKITKGF
jgi:acid phosphatase (class A)